MRINTRSASVFVVVLLHICLTAPSAFASFPRAQNITWKSSNFKTVLMWGPQPTPDYSYTVEYSREGHNQQRNPHCIRTSRTQCDLTSSMTDLSACYTAFVVSEPPQGAPAELIEYPFTAAPKFCPYQETVILSPSFRLKVGPDLRTTTVHVTDPLTAVFRDGQQLTIRDVFGDELEYLVFYRKNKSSGKKEAKSRSNVVEVKGLDKGQSYCFQVQAVVRSQSGNAPRLGELSQAQCTSQSDPSLLDQYSVVVIAGAVLLPLLLLGAVIAVIVICCRRKKKRERRSEKDAQALNI